MTDAVHCRREEALKRAVLAGDEAAWRVWYDETFEGVRRFVVWQLRSQPDRSDEVLQETWLVAVRRIREFDPHRAGFAEWMRGIAANVLRSQMRKWGAVSMKPLPENVTCSPNDDATEAKSRSERITEVLQFLPGRYAAVLREKYLEQKSVSEIAASWNETAKGVESLLTRAREAFRQAFGMDETA
jgi:RNA polymerase sigma-70 factor (ECF subfamily)